MVELNLIPFQIIENKQLFETFQGRLPLKLVKIVRFF